MTEMTRTRARTVASTMGLVLDATQARPASLRASLGLGAGYVAFLALAVLGFLALKGARAEAKPRVGDFVTYRYEGLFTPEPVTLTHEIAAVGENRVRIEVTATRGAETRRWIQVLEEVQTETGTTTALAELHEIREDGVHPLSNEEGRDLARLLDWILIVPDGPIEESRTAPCSRQVGNAALECLCTFERNHWEGRVLEVTASACPYAWRYGPGSFRDGVTGEFILRSSVVDFGNHPPGSG